MFLCLFFHSFWHMNSDYPYAIFILVSFFVCSIQICVDRKFLQLIWHNYIKLILLIRKLVFILRFLILIFLFLFCFKFLLFFTFFDYFLFFYFCLFCCLFVFRLNPLLLLSAFNKLLAFINFNYLKLLYKLLKFVTIKLMFANAIMGFSFSMFLAIFFASAEFFGFVNFERTKKPHNI